MATAIAPTLKSDYSKLADGDLDPIWFYNGSPNGARQAASTDRIGAIKDPFGGSFKVQRHIIHAGDFPNYGGNRCEVLSQGAIGFKQDEHIQMLMGVAIPSDFHSSASGWNSLMDFHYPNNGPAQSPLTFTIRNSNELWCNVKGGPLNSDGTMGTQQRDIHLLNMEVGKYYDILIDVLAGITAQSGSLTIVINNKVYFDEKLAVISGGRPNSTYIKEGFYMSAGDGAQIIPSGRKMYLKDTLFWGNGKAKLENVLAFLGWDLAGGVIVQPDPVTPVVLNGNVQATKDVKVGSEWQVSSSPQSQSVKFGINDKQTVVTGPASNFVFKIPDDTKLGIGNCELTAYDAAGHIVAHYGPFPVNFIPGAVPVETNAQLVTGILTDLANEWVDLRFTTVGLHGKPNYPAPHWKNAHDASVRAIEKIKKIK